MAKFIKHVGKHGDRKVAVVFREVPGDSHLCLVVYTELLNQNIHDPLIACIESPEGQSVDNLADALNRAYTKDGNIILQVLHREGMLKRVQTEHIMMTPSPNQKIKLSELNSILTEMSKGEEAVRKLAEIDASRGLQDPKDVAKRMRGESTVNMPAARSNSDAILGNDDIATNLRSQAIRMTNEAKGLLAEADRLLKEASQMSGVSTEVSRPKKVRAKKTEMSQIIKAAPVVQEVKKTTRGKKASMLG